MLLAPAVFLLLAQQATLAPEWDFKAKVGKLTAEVTRLRPMLERLDPAQWRDTGAGAAYQTTWQYCTAEGANLERVMENMAAQPEKLSVAVELLVHLESFSNQLTWLNGGVRRHHNPAIADLIEGVLGEMQPSRDGLRRYVQDLAALREQELEIASQEAQRCRAQLAKPGATQERRKQ
jgi:hypothetical protein